ncbi:MAG TPA: TIGR03936 family radical SAM-associated protein, partial [Candidatus Limnocylindrales bacterium]
MNSPAGRPGREPAPAPPPATLPVVEPRQRWRLTYARPSPATAGDVGRDYATSWEEALRQSGLPIATMDAVRPRLSFGAPLPTGIEGRAELIELWLTDRLPAWRVRDGLAPVLPVGHRLVDLENVWLGAPALPGRITGAVYLITLGTSDEPRLAAGVQRLVAADRLPRERQKGGTTRTYDLRPLIADLVLEPDAASPTLRLTTRIHPELG